LDQKPLKFEFSLSFLDSKNPGRITALLQKPWLVLGAYGFGAMVALVQHCKYEHALVDVYFAKMARDHSTTLKEGLRMSAKRLLESGLVRADWFDSWTVPGGDFFEMSSYHGKACVDCDIYFKDEKSMADGMLSIINKHIQLHVSEGAS
jgi:hypothetical protein